MHLDFSFLPLMPPLHKCVEVMYVLFFEGEWEIPRGERCFLPPPT